MTELSALRPESCIKVAQTCCVSALENLIKRRLSIA